MIDFYCKNISKITSFSVICNLLELKMYQVA